MGSFFGGSSGRRKNTLGNRVRKAEARARKLQGKADMKARLAKANATIKKLSK